MMYYVSIGGANGMVGLALDMSPAAGREAGKARLEVPKLVSSNRLASTPVKWYGRFLDHARLLALLVVPYHSFTFLCTSFGPLQSLRLDNACDNAHCDRQPSDNFGPLLTLFGWASCPSCSCLPRLGPTQPSL